LRRRLTGAAGQASRASGRSQKRADEADKALKREQSRLRKHVPGDQPAFVASRLAFLRQPPGTVTGKASAAPFQGERSSTLPLDKFDNIARRRLLLQPPLAERTPPMAEPEKRAPRLVALCMLGCVLFNYPILALFNVPGAVFGIPVLYMYVFVAWALLIALMVLAVERGSD
jgi:hypothetical protein